MIHSKIEQVLINLHAIAQYQYPVIHVIMSNVYPKGGIFLAFGISVIVVLIIAMILIGMIICLANKRKRKLLIRPRAPTDSSNIYSHTNNYIQQRYNRLHMTKF